ncbi:tonB-dependent receptor [Sporocytophaga myxococcoides]|uniref:TonB-dependent receptor n=2 Tax=Sporocytophaga myxococcoides TaxID=153721 RepID=A0A098LL46_9BACT|nr:tonB-dependent receptor [Sporocytophaga myxococcoides]
MLLSDEKGAFEFRRLETGIYNLECSMLGFRSKTQEIVMNENETRFVTIKMEEGFLQIDQITVSPRKEVNYFNAIDFRLRPTQTTQDLLRLVPGLFIAQHAGGGKAEQIFIRGFDVDHGTDIAISVDGMPVNMVSQAHGQGYADLHFVIPETVEGMDFSKGPYDTKIGNFNTAGAVRFQTLNYLKKNVVKFEAGSFNTYRGLAMLKLLDKADSTNSLRQNAYLASEFVTAKGYFDFPQNFDRLNIMGKYTTDLNSSTSLSLSLSTFSSRWDASGQIPERAVRSGLISWYGAIDPTEGGNTSRSNANLTLVKTLNDGAVIRNQLYGINYKFNLYSNFTFFKDDSLNGDEIFQYEERNIFGYNGAYSKSYEILGLKASTIAGVGLRDDNIRDIGLAHSVKRRVLSDIKKGDIDETNANVFIDQSFYLSSRITLNFGLRYDAFTFRYNDRLSDTLGKSRNLNVFSPKVNLYYNLSQGAQLYLSAGKGFHSNDTRVAIMDSVHNKIPAAYGLDFGTNLKVGNRILINAAWWFLIMDTEYTYTGDDGTIGSEGRSRRYGLDLSARGQLNKWLFFDFDFNYCKSRLTDNSDETGYLPLAPKFSSIAGLSIRSFKGFSASLRYRYLGERPAAEDNSIIAKGYFIMDAVVNYTTDRFQIYLSAENLFNQKWKEAQFATESRLRGENEPVTEIHFTPGTPLFVKAGITYLF